MGETAVERVSGGKAKRAREDVSFSQRELAELANISPATLNNIENNNIKRPHPSTLRKIAAALGVEPRELRADSE